MEKLIQYDLNIAIAMCVCIAILALINVGPIMHGATHTSRQMISVYSRIACLTILGMGVFFVPFAVFFIGYIETRDINIAWSLLGFFEKNFYWKYGGLLLASAAAPTLLKMIWSRRIKPEISAWLRSRRVVQTSEKESDIRVEFMKYKQMEFDPTEYYQEGKIFAGLDEHKSPIYIPYEVFKETHTQIIGPTRFGKGIEIAILQDQAIINNHCVIHIGPKFDKFAGHLLYQRAKSMGRTFYYLNLNTGTMKWSPFLGGGKRSRRARMLNAFDMEDSGSNADYYRKNERRALDDMHAAGLAHIPDMVAVFEDNEDLKETAHGLYLNLLEWKDVPTVSVTASPTPYLNGMITENDDALFSIEKAIEENAVVYVVGSLDDNVVRKMTQAFLNECVSEINRLKSKRTTPATLIVDELKFLVSDSVSNALSTIAGYGCNMIVAYQGINQLLNPKDQKLNGKEIKDSVDTNCQIKIVYRAIDPETAKWASELSGTKGITALRLEKTKVGDFGEETWGEERTLTQAQVEYISPNVFKALPPRVGAIFEPSSLPKVLHTDVIKVTEWNEAILEDFAEIQKESGVEAPFNESTLDEELLKALTEE